MDGLLNRPFIYRPRAPGTDPLYVSGDLCCWKVNQTTTKRHKTATSDYKVTTKRRRPTTKIHETATNQLQRDATQL